ncbi:MAG: carboxypeptidase-like regulatory domain-containing protein [Cyclobacteriaceae bacterium]|nr:carboxypeptidase-like regulatory domain-containing protein [Cyclobacteriaceae bacterium]UYN86274.1 MAG: carboxypeptidase-like regulatory domain-containing protein [Cyclobacteriaceae bacterium]
MMRQSIIILFLLLPVWMVGAQPSGVFIIEGRLTDVTTGEPVQYASIGIEGASVGTSSNADGYFSLRVPASYRSKNYSLKISCVGYDNEIVKNPSEKLDISLKQSKTMLKDVVVFGKDLSPQGIVKRAFANIKHNYYTKPFMYQTFYRHYCKDDSVYGRLIEAAADVYKRKGYKVQQPFPGWKDEVRVNQLRRSYDNTKVASGHVPIALYSIMGTDPVGYQAKSSSSIVYGLHYANEVSHLRKNLNAYEFTLEGITEYDNEQVYVIQYKLKRDSTLLSTGIPWKNKQKGTLHITTSNYAIVKSEFTGQSSIDTVYTFSIFKKIDGKYFLYHSLKDGRTYQPRLKSTHNFHIELITTDIVTTDIKPFKGKEPDRDKLLSIDYDSTFWNNYNVLKATPLEESIVADLEKAQPLKDQFTDYITSEKERYLSGKEDEERFNKFLQAARGYRPVYIDVWASWCGPCIREMPASMELVEKYKARVAFVYLSIDDDSEAWRKALKRYNIDRPFLTNHFRIGSNADAVALFDIKAIPRYILIDKKGNFVNLNAMRPSESSISKELDRLLAEEIEK